jgi:hypothetical protein
LHAFAGIIDKIFFQMLVSPLRNGVLGIISPIFYGVAVKYD